MLYYFKDVEVFCNKNEVMEDRKAVSIMEKHGKYLQKGCLGNGINGPLSNRKN